MDDQAQEPRPYLGILRHAEHQRLLQHHTTAVPPQITSEPADAPEEPIVVAGDAIDSALLELRKERDGLRDEVRALEEALITIESDRAAQRERADRAEAQLLWVAAELEAFRNLEDDLNRALGLVIEARRTGGR